MSTKPIVVFKGDNAPKIIVNIKDFDTGGSIDLQSPEYAVSARVHKRGSTTLLFPEVSCDKSGFYGATGEVVFVWPATITYPAGLYEINFVITFTAGTDVERVTAQNSVLVKIKDQP